MNIRHFISNIEEKEARELYFGFYVLRGEASENRIKEVKNMCFSDRLSNHGYWANFFAFLLVALPTKCFCQIKKRYRKLVLNLLKNGK